HEAQEIVIGPLRESCSYPPVNRWRKHLIYDARNGCVADSLEVGFNCDVFLPCCYCDLGNSLAFFWRNPLARLGQLFAYGLAIGRRFNVFAPAKAAVAVSPWSPALRENAFRLCHRIG